MKKDEECKTMTFGAMLRVLRRRKSLAYRVALALAISWLAFTSLATFYQNESERAIKQQQQYILADDDANEYLPKISRKAVDDNAPGENGRAFVMDETNAVEKQRKEEMFKRSYLNEYASNRISLHRSLPDLRTPECKERPYPLSSMPKVSVIICFHNEALSVVLRTVHSILNRSPEHLLEEVILVDDYSDRQSLQKPLTDYVAKLDKVRLLRCDKREGLIRGRLLGAKVASAPVLVFLDGHCECTKGWLEPLLYRIYENESHVVVPVIDTIGDKTLVFNGHPNPGTIQVGGFDWELMFSWHQPPTRDMINRKHDWDPIKSPTMAGGLFAISKSFFEHLGTYDAAMDFWGGENLELSFKTWLCGGSLETMPCSHVGHIFRQSSPHNWPKEHATRKNTIRLALVWMDHYAKYFFDRLGTDVVRAEKHGDISERIQLRQSLGCKNFQYFVDNVWPEIEIPKPTFASGELRNALNRNESCLDQMRDEAQGTSPQMYPCHGDGGHQYWMYNLDRQIQSDDGCIEKKVAEFGIHLAFCINKPSVKDGSNQIWNYDPTSHLIVLNSTNLCLDAMSNSSITLSKCDSTIRSQLWYFQRHNNSLFIEFSKVTQHSSVGFVK